MHSFLLWNEAARKSGMLCMCARACSAGGKGAARARLRGQQGGVLVDQRGERGRGHRLICAVAQHHRALHHRLMRQHHMPGLVTQASP